MTALVKPLTWILGVVFVVIGAAGYVITLPVFEVNAVHNIVHLASGIVALITAGMGLKAARTYLIVFGIVYLLVAVLGFMGVQFVVDLLALNTADNYLHTAIAAACLIVGFGSKEA